MRRSIFTFALAGLFAGFLFSSDASACHKKKACATPCETVTYAAPAPVCAPAPVETCAPKKKCFSMPKMKMGGLCHKKQATCETVTYAAPTYAAPATYASPQVMAAPQATRQGM